MNMPLRVKYGGKKVFCTFDTIQIRTIMEKMGDGKKFFRLPEGYYIEFVNTDLHSERPVVGKICRELVEEEERELTAEDIKTFIDHQLGGYKVVHIGLSYRVINKQFIYESDVNNLVSELLMRFTITRKKGL